MELQQETRVKLEVSDRVAYVTIDRPDAKNAMTKLMYAAIRDAVLASEKNDEVDVVVLRGANGTFATGGDLKEILSALENDPTAILDYEEYLPFEAVRSITKPTIAAVDGLCIGGGLTLALMCDIILASDRSRFAIPEAKIGIVDGHLPRLLRSVVPPAKLRYWMYTGALFPAVEASDVGLITRVVPVAEMDEAVAKCVRELRAISPAAIGVCKRILNEVRPLSPMTDAYLSLLQPEVLKRLQQFRDK